jgi:hypothetical protein
MRKDNGLIKVFYDGAACRIDASTNALQVRGVRTFSGWILTAMK